MGNGSPREIAVGFFEDVGAGRFDTAFGRLAPDVAYEVIAPPPYGGRMDREGLGQVYGNGIGTVLAQPLQLKVVGVTAEGERVAIEVESRSVNKAGMVYNNRYHFLFVVRDGQIVEGREYLDSAHFIAILDV